MPRLLIQPKQINKLLIAPVYISGWVLPAATTTFALASAALTTGLAGAPLQVSSSVPTDLRGLVVTGLNIVQVWTTATKSRVFSATNEVYARLTFAAGVYTAAFFTNVAGTETAFTFATGTTVDLVFPYQYDFATLPVDALMVVPERYVDPSQGGSGFAEVLAVTAVNTLAAISQPPNLSKPMALFVNGIQVDALTAGGGAGFTVAGTAVTWVPLVVGYALATTDRVVITYNI